MDFLIKVWDFAYNFFFIGVIGYLLKKTIADQIMKYGHMLITKTERNTAIWRHYNNQALGKGHDSKDVLDCDQDHCYIFHTYAN